MKGSESSLRAAITPSIMAALLQSVIVMGVLGGLGNAVRAKCNCDVGSKADHLKGYDIKPTGLKPRYPDGWQCTPLTSLYASWIDVDGSIRDEIHSGIDGGRLGDALLAPGPGIVRAVWRANWGWGEEGALLIRHSPSDLNLPGKRPFYYSEFDHLRLEEIAHFRVGQRVSRGEPLAHVYRPGGNGEYLPEVHWEVWEIAQDDDLSWNINKFGGRYWTNESARLIDPLYLLALNSFPASDGDVLVTPFAEDRDFRTFRGFTYILPCRRNAPIDHFERRRARQSTRQGTRQVLAPKGTGGAG